jgi:hypothetical protein
VRTDVHGSQRPRSDEKKEWRRHPRCLQMTSDDTLAATLDLLSGAPGDPIGGAPIAGLEHIQLARDDWRALFFADGAISSALDAGRRVVVPVPLSGGTPAARLVNVLFARLRLWRAVRVLRRGGVTRTRVFAAVAGADALFVVYELSAAAQSYAEQQIVVEPRALAPPARLLRAMLRACAPVSLAVDLVVVVGDRG